MSSPLTHGGRDADKAFTLIELLTVIAIIGILAAITFGVSTSVRQKAKISQARTELATLATALESYKKQYGDYPQTGSNNAPLDPAETPEITYTHTQSLLAGALLGSRGPKLDVIPGKPFIEEAKHTIVYRDYTEVIGTVTYNRRASAILDPWGRRYLYAYRSVGSPSTWRPPGYVLFSAGPDGKTKDVANDPNGAGEVDFSHADNLDNIYVNR